MASRYRLLLSAAVLLNGLVLAGCETGGISDKLGEIGDSVTDVATARAANVPVILVSYGYTPEPADTLGADAVTADFAEIPRLARALGL